MACWGGNKGTPLLSVLGQLLIGPLGVSEDLDFPFYSATLGVPGLPPFSFSSGVQ